MGVCVRSKVGVVPAHAGNHTAGNRHLEMELKPVATTHTGVMGPGVRRDDNN